MRTENGTEPGEKDGFGDLFPERGFNACAGMTAGKPLGLSDFSCTIEGGWPPKSGPDSYEHHEKGCNVFLVRDSGGRWTAMIYFRLFNEILGSLMAVCGSLGKALDWSNEVRSELYRKAMAMPQGGAHA